MSYGTVELCAIENLTSSDFDVDYSSQTRLMDNIEVQGLKFNRS
jgi:hypothetical protein